MSWHETSYVLFGSFGKELKKVLVISFFLLSSSGVKNLLILFMGFVMFSTVSQKRIVFQSCFFYEQNNIPTSNNFIRVHTIYWICFEVEILGGFIKSTYPIIYILIFWIWVTETYKLFYYNVLNSHHSWLIWLT